MVSRVPVNRRAMLVLAATLLAGPAVPAPAVAAPAVAADPSSLGRALFGSESSDFDRPSVARYRDDVGGGFTFDRQDKHEALLKFDGDPEVWALRPTPGPHGDVIYKNDRDEPVLRATQVGGLTLFTSSQPQGVAAAFMGEAAATRSSSVLGPEAFIQLVAQASARASRAAQHLVEFDVPEVTPPTEAVFAQAVIITSAAFTRVGQRKDGQGLIARIMDVRFLPGRNPSAVAKGQTMQITVAPQLGVAGRPSSEWIVQVISRR